MRLSDILSETDLRAALEAIEEPVGGPPREKGSDAIKVHGYLVRGHWRRHWYPPQKRAVKPPRRIRLVTSSGQYAKAK